MSKRLWMPLYIADWSMDTRELRPDEKGIYHTMLTLAWRREDAALPNDMEWLKRALKYEFAEFHGATFNRVIPMLLKRYFSLGADDKWRNKRLSREAEITDKRSANGRQMNDKRWLEHRNFKQLSDRKGLPTQIHISKREFDKDVANLEQYREKTEALKQQWGKKDERDEKPL